MGILLTLLEIVAAYFFFIFCVCPFIIPHLWRIRVPKKIPDDMRTLVTKLSAEHAHSDTEFIAALLDVLKDRYVINAHQTHTSPWILFRTDITKIWVHKGANQACTVLNLLLKTMLITSGRFSENAVREKLTMLNLNIHQYLVVDTHEGRIAADPWGYLAHKARLGEYCTGFAVATIR